MSIPQPQDTPQPSWDTESPHPPFLRYREKIPVRLCAACQKHCSSKVICSKVHYHHHLWWWIPYDGGRPAAASTHNDILLLLAVTPRQMAHSQQPACQTEHTHNTGLGLAARNRGDNRNGAWKADFICGKAAALSLVSMLLLMQLSVTFRFFSAFTSITFMYSSKETGRYSLWYTGSDWVTHWMVCMSNYRDWSDNEWAARSFHLMNRHWKENYKVAPVLFDWQSLW